MNNKEVNLPDIVNLRKSIDSEMQVSPEKEIALMEFVMRLLRKGLTHNEICGVCDITRDAIYRAQDGKGIRTVTHWKKYGSRKMKKPHNV